jgi:hypothetical protein
MPSAQGQLAATTTGQLTCATLIPLATHLMTVVTSLTFLCTAADQTFVARLLAAI